MSLALKTVKNDTKSRGYCGPVVVCAITGKPLSKVLHVIRWVRFGKWFRTKAPPIKGIYSWEVSRTLVYFGYLAIPVAWPGVWGRDEMMRPTTLKYPTFAQWLKGRDKKACYLLNIGNHWVLVKGYSMCDTFTHGVPMKLSQNHLHRRRRVKDVYIIEKRRRGEDE